MTRRLRRLVPCVCCGRRGRLNARGLIGPCYRRLWRVGALEQYPSTKQRAGRDVLDRWKIAATRPPIGTTIAEIAARIGISRTALNQVLCRARRDGDPRAIYLPHPRTGVIYAPSRYRQQREATTEGGE